MRLLSLQFIIFESSILKKKTFLIISIQVNKCVINLRKSVDIEIAWSHYSLHFCLDKAFSFKSTRKLGTLKQIKVRKCLNYARKKVNCSMILIVLGLTLLLCHSKYYCISLCYMYLLIKHRVVHHYNLTYCKQVRVE